MIAIEHFTIVLPMANALSAGNFVTLAKAIDASGRRWHGRERQRTSKTCGSSQGQLCSGGLHGIIETKSIGSMGDVREVFNVSRTRTVWGRVLNLYIEGGPKLRYANLSVVLRLCLRRGLGSSNKRQNAFQELLC